MDKASAIAMALDGVDEGYRVIASRLNSILDIRCPDLKIKSEDKKADDSMQRASRKVKDAWHYLGTSVPRVELVSPWTLGLLHPGPVERADGKIRQENVQRLINTNGYLDESVFELLMNVKWNKKDWKSRIVIPIEQFHQRWRSYLQGLLEEKPREKIPWSSLATELDVSVHTIYRLRDKGHIKPHGKPQFVYRDELDLQELRKKLVLQKKRQLPKI